MDSRVGTVRACMRVHNICIDEKEGSVPLEPFAGRYHPESIDPMVHLTDDVGEGRPGERTDAEERNHQSMRAKVTHQVRGMRRPAVRKKGRVMAGDARRARQQRDQEM